MADDFATEVRELWDYGHRQDKDNRAEALIDLQFAGFEQWDPVVRSQREAVSEKQPFPLPCLTINNIPQYTGQVTGDRRANQTSIKVLPRESGDKKTAEVRSELIRSIELQSKADRVRMQAFEMEVTCGIGNTRIDLDWAYEDAFERDLFIRGIPNPMAVNWDPLSADPTGRDAGWCFVADRIPEKEYERRFPKAAKVDAFDAEGEWCSEGLVRIAEYWRIDERERMIAMLENGDVVDITGTDPQRYKGPLPILEVPSKGKQVRKTKCKYAVRTLTNGQEELDDNFELKLYRLPIVRWMGREVWIGEKRVRFGLVRAMRDQQRLKNYLRSVAAQKLMFAPRDNFIAAFSAIKGREGDWPNTRVYNDNAVAPPQPVTENTLQALIQMSELFAQDMKDVTGLHDASLGIRSNETSGVAIQRRQNEGDIATIGYHDNANAAMQEEGEILNELISLAYDKARTIRVIGEDEATRLVRINDPAFEPTDLVKENVNLATGKYDVAISTGPAYMTRRQEAAAQLVELARANPNFATAAPDLMIAALDIPDGDVIAERLKRTVPPQILGPDASDDETPEAKAMKAQQQAAAQQQQDMEMQAAQAELRIKLADADKAEAEAVEAQAKAKVAQIEFAAAQTQAALTGARMSEMAADMDEQANGLEVTQ